ncbi:MAG: UvrB/UvrC motif-containing protein [Spirochaetales bacterium]|nr:UvrB/UvrC motif-containing protein [Spirochaetales bacterium]MCF7938341.1 UvrB/UvrC motif-containing protein [Spirochaetales bacterium]
MIIDLTDALQGWQYDPEHSVRIVRAGDGRKVMQVRLPLGIEQYELDGRPDGKRPFGRDSVLEEYQYRLNEYRSEQGTDEGFEIDEHTFKMLQNEAILFYYRYLHLYQIADYRRTTRDTQHNLDLIFLVERFYHEENRLEVLQYKPYILRMNALARAMMSMNRQVKETAVQILEAAIDQIDAMEEIETPAFKFERMRSLYSLRNMLDEVQDKPLSESDELSQSLQEALEEENYELAAQLRDKIRELDTESKKSSESSFSVDNKGPSDFGLSGWGPAESGETP